MATFADELGFEMDNIQEILLNKNRAYGNAALEPIRVFSKLEPDAGLRVRIDDKLSRLARGESAGEDVILDLIGYLVLLRMHMRTKGAR